MPENRGLRKVREGHVVSDRMDKTLVVQVERLTVHPLYKKIVRRSKKYHVHDEENRASVGDRVRIVETRPVSKTKRWRLLEVLREGKVEGEAEGEAEGEVEPEGPSPEGGEVA